MNTDISSYINAGLTYAQNIWKNATRANIEAQFIKGADLTKQYLNTHSYPQIYCAAVTAEIALHIIADLARLDFYEVGHDAVNLVLFGFGATNPIAGIVVPLSLAAADRLNRQEVRTWIEETRKYEIWFRPSQFALSERYILCRPLRGVDYAFEKVAEEACKTLHVERKTALIAVTLFAVVGVSYAMGATLPTLPGFKPLSITISMGS